MTCTRCGRWILDEDAAVGPVCGPCVDVVEQTFRDTFGIDDDALLVRMWCEERRAVLIFEEPATDE